MPMAEATLQRGRVSGFPSTVSGTSPRRAGGRGRGFWGGFERGRPVPGTMVASSSPWTLPILLGLAALMIVIPRIDLGNLPGGDTVRDATQGLPIGAIEVLAVVGGLVLLFARSSLPWLTRVLLVFGAWAYATYNVGLLSWGAIQEMIVRLANQPGVDVFEAPPPGITEAGLVLAFFLLLTPVLGLVVMVLVWAWSAFVEEIFKPFGRRRLLPEWVLMLPFVAGFSALAYAGNSVWLPWCLWVLGVIARAYVLTVG